MVTHPHNKWLSLSLIVLTAILISAAFIFVSVDFAGAQEPGFACDQIPEAECAALEALYVSTDGDQWINKEGWLQSSTPCSWFGITCSEDSSHIDQIILANNNLYGPIPAQVQDLTQLTWLDLGANNLEGLIPVELGTLSSLQTLYLAGNRLEGSIPYQLGDLQNLELLYLNRNKLDGTIPAQIGAISGLQFLYLDGSQLSGAVPASLCSLNELVTSNLGYNKLDVQETDGCIDQIDPLWAESQTVPPDAVQAVIPQSAAAENYAIEVSWDPIDYEQDAGYYEIHMATESGGPYQLVGRTTDKTVSNYTVRDLQASIPYYFIVRTVTNPTDNNQNELMSEASKEVTGTPSVLSLTQFEVDSSSFPILILSALLLLGLTLLVLIPTSPLSIWLAKVISPD